MRILLINQYYRPDMAATAMMLTDLAEHLASCGNDVDILCSRGSYNAAADAELPAKEMLDGVRVRRLRQWGSRKKSSISRGLEYLGFHAQCLPWLLMKGWKYDIIVTLTDPPLIGLHGTLFRWCSFGSAKYVHWSMDLFPETVIKLGALKEKSLLARILGKLSAREYRSAATVVPLGSCMADLLRDKGVREERLRVIGVWNRADTVVPIETSTNPLRKEVFGEQDAPSAFVLMYSGNAGRAHAFGSVCEGMRRLDASPDIDARFLFVGGGNALGEIEAFVESNELTNFKHMGYFPREQLSESLGIGDVHLVTLKDEMSGLVVPSKLYGIMAAARPILYVGPESSTVAWQIREADCGIVLQEGDHDGFADAVQKLAADPDERKRLGENGRRFFLENNEMTVCCDQWNELLHDVAGKPLGQVETS